jgi:hypothetical protein
LYTEVLSFSQTHHLPRSVPDKLSSPYPFSLMFILVYLPIVHRSSKYFLFVSAFSQNSACISVVFHLFPMFRLSHAPLFDCHNYIFPGVRIMKLFMQLLQHPVTSSLLGQNILSFLFSKTHSLCVFFPLWETSFYIHTIQ